MCNLSKGVEEYGRLIGRQQGLQEGLKEGLKEGILSSIINLMDSMGWSAERAMDALKIPESEQRLYFYELNKQ